MRAAHFILYINNQERSARFYEAALGSAPRLHVAGMTEFDLGPGTVLGLMPSVGIVRLLGGALPDPERAAGVPRAELYLVVEDAAAALGRAIGAGATLLSPVLARDWGHAAGYCLDPDGHVLAFAEV